MVQKVGFDRGEKLRNCAMDLLQDISLRVTQKQGGVNTFSDKYLVSLITKLFQHFPSDDWVDAWQRVVPDRISIMKWEVGFLRSLLALAKQGRFVSRKDRLALAALEEAKPYFHEPYGDSTDRPTRVMSQGLFQCMHWKGMPLFKTVFDFSLYSMMIWDIRPKTIIEIGSGTGASAIWMADLIKSYSLDCAIYTMDISKPSMEYDGVCFMEGDAYEIEAAFPDSTLNTLPHPWLVIEDAHVNVVNVANHFGSKMRKGDYLVIEDSRSKKEKDVSEWYAKEEENFLVDTLYTDFFGRNATCSPDSIFVRR